MRSEKNVFKISSISLRGEFRAIPRIRVKEKYTRVRSIRKNEFRFLLSYLIDPAKAKIMFHPAQLVTEPTVKLTKSQFSIS